MAGQGQGCSLRAGRRQACDGRPPRAGGFLRPLSGVTAKLVASRDALQHTRLAAGPHVQAPPAPPAACAHHPGCATKPRKDRVRLRASLLRCQRTPLGQQRLVGLWGAPQRRCSAKSDCPHPRHSSFTAPDPPSTLPPRLHVPHPPLPRHRASDMADIPPNQTIYVQNLPEKIKKHGGRRWLPPRCAAWPLAGPGAPCTPAHAPLEPLAAGHRVMEPP